MTDGYKYRRDDREDEGRECRQDDRESLEENGEEKKR